MRDPVGPDVGWQNNPVGSRLKKLSFGGGHLSARNDLDVWSDIACAQGDENIGSIVGKNRGQHPCTSDSRRVQDRFIGGFSCDAQPSGIVGLGYAAWSLIDHDKRDASRLQLGRKHAADSAEAANDGVVFELGDFLFHTFASEGLNDLGFREQLHQAAGDKNNSTAAENDQPDGPQSEPRSGHGDDLPEADAERGDEHHVEGIHPRPTRQTVATGEDRHDRDHVDCGVNQIGLWPRKGFGHGSKLGMPEGAVNDGGENSANDCVPAGE